jgi:hypothetical protein
VFAPVFLDARGAVAVGVMATCVIGWIYWREGLQAWRERRWHSGLIIPAVFTLFVVALTATTAQRLAQGGKDQDLPVLSAISGLKNDFDSSRHYAHPPPAPEVTSPNPKAVDVLKRVKPPVSGIEQGAVADIALQPFKPLSDGGYALPVAIKNAGNGPMLNYGEIVEVVYSPNVLSGQEQDEKLYNKAALRFAEDRPAPLKQGGIFRALKENSEYVIFSRDATLSEDHMQDVLSGRESAYLLALVYYMDSVHSRQIYVAEYCAKYDAASTMTAQCHRANFAKKPIQEFK